MIGIFYRIIRILFGSFSCKLIGHAIYFQSHGFQTKNHYGIKICGYCNYQEKVWFVKNGRKVKQ